MKEVLHFKRISDYHKLANLKAPQHPLISLIDYTEIKYPENSKEIKWRQDYYTIGLKRNVAYKLFYGQQEYDFDEGVMTFIAPNQVMSLGENPNLNTKPSGWLLLIHPDFFWNTNLAKKIKGYEFFGYSVNEALFLSEKEEGLIISLLENIAAEYASNIDKFSQDIIISQLTTLLNYANRFYERQFITREKLNHRILNDFELVLLNSLSDEELEEKGLPTVQKIAEKLSVTPNYLTGVLKHLTGQNTQQHIQNSIIKKAKEELSVTNYSVSEIAYKLGFEYPSSFTKLFKSKTAMSPSEFRKNFN